MIITKILETKIDLSESDQMYSADIDSTIIQKLAERYVNKCYQSVLITNIIKIIRRSSIIMADNRLDGGAYVDVQFEIEGMILVKDEILTGCTIIEIHDNNTTITAEHKYAGIKLQKDPHGVMFKILKIGQKIPIIVQKVRYTPNQSTISVIAIPYTPVKSTNCAYMIQRALNIDDTTKIGFIIDQITVEEKKHIDISKHKMYSFFRDILYPFKNNQKFENSKIVTEHKYKPVELELKQLLTIKNGTLLYPIEDPRHNKRLFWSQNETHIPEYITVVSDMYSAVSEILFKFLMYLHALRGLMETYETPEQVQELMTYWKLCQSVKL